MTSGNRRFQSKTLIRYFSSSSKSVALLADVESGADEAVAALDVAGQVGQARWANCNCWLIESCDSPSALQEQRDFVTSPAAVDVHAKRLFTRMRLRSAVVSFQPPVP